MVSRWVAVSKVPGPRSSARIAVQPGSDLLLVLLVGGTSSLRLDSTAAGRSVCAVHAIWRCVVGRCVISVGGRGRREEGPFPLSSSELPLHDTLQWMGSPGPESWGRETRQGPGVSRLPCMCPQSTRRCRVRTVRRVTKQRYLTDPVTKLIQEVQAH